MALATIDEKIRAFQDMVGSSERVGVSDFARSKDWRDKLPDVGCLEVVDRNGVIGYMVAPDYAEALSAKITALEEQLERAQIAAMFKERAGRSDLNSGDALKAAALDYFDDNADRLQEIIDVD